MQKQETLSTQLYDYLCEAVGSEKVVAARRWFFKVFDDCENTRENGSCITITSGSKAEGLDFSSSDLDIMVVLPTKVYCHNSAKNYHQLCYDMNNSQPGFCRIKFCLFQNNSYNMDFINRFFLNFPLFDIVVTNSNTEIVVSCQNLKHFVYFRNIQLGDDLSAELRKQHGPCLSTYDDSLDIAYSFHCPVWPSQASNWITRHKLSGWPSVDLISSIVRLGILFVPLGGLDIGSPHEWRISYSVGEKMLIHSMNHTQLLCYALMKFLLKEIIDDIPDLQNLLCSYFMKTVLFWVCEEIDGNNWMQKNLTSCFQQCLKRLMYFVNYGYCPNYFMPDNNMFKNKIYGESRQKLSYFLSELYKGGIIYIVMNCKSLSGFLNTTTHVENLVKEEDHGIYPLLQYLYHLYLITQHQDHHLSRILSKIYSMRKFPPKLAKDLYLMNMTERIRHSVMRYFHYNLHLGNRRLYSDYKFCRVNLLMTTASTVSDWLYLAVFFYSHRQIQNALIVIDFVLSESKRNKLVQNQPMELLSSSNKALQLKFAKRYKMTYINRLVMDFTRIEKSFLMPFYRELSSESTYAKICIKPFSPELYTSEIFKEIIDTTYRSVPAGKMSLRMFGPICLAHYIRCVCYHHLGDQVRRQQSINDLKVSVDYHYNGNHFLLHSSCMLLQRISEISGSCIDITPYSLKCSTWALEFLSKLMKKEKFSERNIFDFLKEEIALKT